MGCERVFFLMVYRWEGPKLNYQHLLHMFTNIGDLLGPFCCVSYLRCKGDTRSINSSTPMNVQWFMFFC